MSTLSSTARELPDDMQPGDIQHGDLHHRDDEVAASPLVVRRRASLVALIAAAASAVAIAYLWRATATMTPLDWSVFALMALLAGYHLVALVDARTPLATADDLGVRIRLDDEWRGLSWEAIDRVTVHPRRGLLRDGRIVLTPRSSTGEAEGLQGRARRRAALNQKAYAAALAVPVGVTTRVTTRGEGSAVDQLTALAAGRAEVVEVAPVAQPVEPEPVDPTLKPRVEPVETRVPAQPAARDHPRSALPLRVTRPAIRTQMTRDVPASPGNTTPYTTPGEPITPDLQALPPTERRARPDDGDPVPEPVIGAELTAARNRLGMSVDELSDRTRIRPHVIESIEVDDFSPCGGDFYARGHLLTLARFLGTDPAPLAEAFDARYATAPVNARMVFDAELATGMRAATRARVGGPNWGLLIGVVLCIVLVWGVVRFFAAEPVEVLRSPTPALGSGGLAGERPALGSGGPVRRTPPAARPVSVTVHAAHAASRVAVRDGRGRVVLSTRMELGERESLRLRPPIHVRARDAGAVEVSVRGQDRGVLGVLGEPGRRSFR